MRIPATRDSLRATLLWALLVTACREQRHVAAYVGSGSCASCHAAESRRWSDSHHALAMRVAADSTVAGDFTGARFTYAGTTTTFSRRDGRFIVRTDGPDGRLHDYDVKYTFGVAPLQQYLLELPGGRLQALGIAWDTRPRESGGQRWFHLYQGQRVTHASELHWTGAQQNWNYMCADCHSTAVRKNYDTTTRAFATRFSEPSVGCEACHGPGSLHVASAGRTALATQPRATQVESCARCHSRREQFSEYVPGTSLGNAYRVTLLDAPLYHVDGQIRDEVFEYGSFAQSRMYAKGVVCSDCHDPHTARLQEPQSAQVCARCHVPAKYAAASHTFHAPGSKGADCVSCHMPTRTYMIVQDRHDHSIRVPRPDLTVALGVPNACANCHADKGAAWAARQVTAWYGRPARGFQRYADAFAGALGGDTGAPRMLRDVVLDTSQPAIARATAIARYMPLATDWNAEKLQVVVAGLHDSSALVRRATAAALGDADAVTRGRLLSALLTDSVRDVRLEGMRALADMSPNVGEYVAAQHFNADRPESGLNLGIVYALQRRYLEAEQSLRASLAIDPGFTPSLVNLADLYRATGRELEAERALRAAVTRDSASSVAHYALGLLLIRKHSMREAIDELRTASRLAPEDAQYRRVYLMALDRSTR